MARDVLPTLEFTLDEHRKKKEFLEIPNDFWTIYPQMMDTFIKKFLGMSDAFLDELSRMLDDFRSKFPGNWYYIWDKSPGLLDSFKQNFPEMSDDFWKVFPITLLESLANYNTESMLCIDYHGGNACSGDSGGPLVTKHASDDGVTPGQNYELIGVASFGKDRECNSSGWTMFCGVTTILAWIEQYAGAGHTYCPRD